MNPLIQVKAASIFLVAFGFVCFALSPSAHAVSPPPDGGYPGGNTAEGQNALLSLTTGGYNTAVGFFSLRSDTTGSYNTGIGAAALFGNNGDQNTATGAGALFVNTGSFNTANGSLALFSNTSGTFNSAVGQGALFSNTEGASNTATGAGELFNNTIGTGNTANGFQALNFNTGSGNTAIGYQALEHNTSGGNNIAVSSLAGLAVTAGDNNIAIGNFGASNESGTIRIGTDQIHTATFIAGISGVTVGNGMTVIIDPNGHLGTIVSSRRFKKEIKPMDYASERLFLLKPVTFHYKEDIDPARISQFGLVAEDVEKVSPDLVVRDKEGKPYSVRYDQVNAMLLNEFLKAHRKMEQQQKQINVLAAQIKEQAEVIQRVRTQIKTSDPVLSAVVNNP